MKYKTHIVLDPKHISETLAQWLDQPELDDMDKPDLEWYKDQDADWKVDEGKS